MSQKNHIKIDAFKVIPMRLSDLPDVLKLAIKAQSSFGITSTASPSLFFKEISLNLQNNFRTSCVFKDNKDRIFGALVFRETTSVSAEFVYMFSDPKVIHQTEEIKKAFTNYLETSKYSEITVQVFKKRKRFESYLKLIKSYGFEEINQENELFLKLIYRKS